MECPPKPRVLTQNPGGITPTSESNMAAQCINRRETVLIYCLLALMFGCVSKHSVVHTVLSTSVCGHDTKTLSVQNTTFIYFELTGIANNERVRLVLLTSVLENGPLGHNVIL